MYFFCIFQNLHNEHAVTFVIRKQTFAVTIGIYHALWPERENEKINSRTGWQWPRMAGNLEHIIIKGAILYPRGKSWVCAQLCPTLCDTMDYSSSGSFVRGRFQARILEWVTISSSRGSFQPRDRTQVSCVSCIDRKIHYHWATWEAQGKMCGVQKPYSCSL